MSRRLVVLAGLVALIVLATGAAAAQTAPSTWRCDPVPAPAGSPRGSWSLICREQTSTTTTTSTSTTTTAAPTTSMSTTTTTAAPTTTTTTVSTTTTTAPPPPPPTGVSCALTYDAKNCWDGATGVPGWTKTQILAGQSPLKHQTGVIVADIDGQVIDGLWLDGCIAVRANNVTIKNSYIRAANIDWNCTGGNQQAGPSAINSGNGSGGAGTVTGLQIIDTEVDGNNISGYVGGIADANYTCLRCDVHGFTINAWALTNVTITDSFFHDNNLNNGTNHADGIDTDSGVNVTLRHNWVAMDGGQDYTTGSVNFGASWSPGSNLTLDANFLAGFGGCDLNLDARTTGLVVTNNAFSNRNGWGGTDFVALNSGSLSTSAVWKGNYIPETGAAFGRP